MNKGLQPLKNCIKRIYKRCIYMNFHQQEIYTFSGKSYIYNEWNKSLYTLRNYKSINFGTFENLDDVLRFVKLREKEDKQLKLKL